MLKWLRINIPLVTHGYEPGLNDAGKFSLNALGEKRERELVPFRHLD